MPRWSVTLLTLLLFAALALAGPAYAEPTAQQIIASSALEQQAYFQGLGDGISWANAAVPKGSKAPYCPPPELAITTDQYLSILQRAVQKEPKLATAAAGDALISGLKRVFPCPNQ